MIAKWSLLVWSLSALLPAQLCAAPEAVGARARLVAAQKPQPPLSVGARDPGWLGKLHVGLPATPLESQLMVVSSRTPEAVMPGNNVDRVIYQKPYSNVVLLGRVSQLVRPEAVLVQYASTPSQSGMRWPYLGAASPKGLIHKLVVKTEWRSDPPQPGMQGEAPFGSKPLRGGNFAQWSLTLPLAIRANPGSDTYVRFVPLKKGAKPMDFAGPPSNWVRFHVLMHEEDWLDLLATQAREAAALRAREEAERKIRAAAEEREKERHAQAAARTAAVAALQAKYEIVLLSYTPPKPYDDNHAADRLRLSRTVENVPIAEGVWETWGEGRSFSYTYACNLLSAQQTWYQQTWDLASGIWNTLSSTYSDAKSAAVNEVAAAVSATGILDCSAECRAALTIALDSALASCGLPPNLPNTDALMSQGGEYLAGNIATAAIGGLSGLDIPPAQQQQLQGVVRDAAATALDGLRERMHGAVAFVADDPNTWGYPDPFFRRRPAMLMLWIRAKPAPVNEQPTTIRIAFAKDAFQPVYLPLPPIPPGGLKLPVVLTPSHPEWFAVPSGYMSENGIAPGEEVGQPGFAINSYFTLNVETQHLLADFADPLVAVTRALGEIPVGTVYARPIHPGQSVEQVATNPLQFGAKAYFGKIYYRPVN